MTKNVNVSGVTQYHFYYRLIDLRLWRYMKEVGLRTKNIARNVLRSAWFENGGCSASDILAAGKLETASLNVNHIAVPTNVFNIKQMALVGDREGINERVVWIGGRR
jgi:hypothetical protein